MEELSRLDFLRLSEAEKDAYLKQLLGEDDDDSSDPSDSEDDEWFPSGNRTHNSRDTEASDNEELENEESANVDEEQQQQEEKEDSDDDAEREVILLSTMHNDAMFSDLAHRKPEMILFYNKTKAGVDTMDQMCMRYSTQRRTCRWPLAFFYNMLDIACVAAYVIYYENNNMLSNKSNRRRIFLRQLSEELAMPVIQERASNQQVMRNHATRLAVESYFEKPVAVVVPADNQRRDVTGRKVVVGSCYICNEQPIRKRRKTRKCCAECEKPVCDEHSVKINKCLHCDQ